MKSFICIFFLFFITVFSAVGQVANFTADITGGCAPLIVHFTNTSIGATSYNWDLGNGVISPIIDPSTSYITAGTYTVTLTAYNGSLSDTNTMIIQVDSAPTVHFFVSDTTVCPGIPVIFTSTSVANASGAVSNLWNFGDGVSSAIDTPSYSFNVPGYYNITLSVTNALGCESALTQPAYVHVYTPAIPDFTVNNTHFCSLPSQAVFTNTTTGTPALSYLWSFGDGGLSTLISPVHDYTVYGTYSVALAVTDGNGCRDTLTRLSYILAATLIPSFTMPDTACLNSPVTFTNTSTAYTSSKWFFGDGDSSATNLTAIHTYSITGTYAVSLIVSDSFCYDTVSHNAAVATGPIASYAISPLQPCPASSAVTYIATAAPGIPIKWTFDDGSTGTNDTIIHSYAVNGEHVVTMNAVSAWGCVTVATDSFLQYDLLLTIPKGDTSGCIPLVIPFSVAVSTDQPDSISHPLPYPYSIVSYTWNFGDGSPSINAIAPSHTYMAAGIYHSVVTVITSNGCTATDSITIAAGVPPVVTFSATPTTVCINKAITFTASSADSVNLYLWFFGDGTAGLPDASGTVQYFYQFPGSYIATLIGLYNGCPGASFTSTNTLIADSPLAVLSAVYPCSLPLTIVSFTNYSIGADSILWIFGDGTTSDSLNPTHNYASTTTYLASLTTYNVTTGCRDTVSTLINIINPSFDFFADDTAICKNGIAVFSSSITGITGGTTFSYLWYINDSLTNFSQSFADTFFSTGTYSIMLITGNIYGCFDTVIKNNYISVAKPLDSFTAMAPTGCLPLSVIFTDSSTDISGVTFKNYTWAFGDGTIISTVTPSVSYTYTVAGVFNVKEIVTDSYGCTDTLTRTGLASTSHADGSFTASTQHTCIGSPVIFTRVSPVTTASQWFFGDGDTSSSPSPAHSYSSPGTYTVMQVVTDLSGCVDTVSYVSYITVTRPFASFMMSDTTAVCPPLSVNFVNTSSGAASYNWGFGDGNSAVGISPNNVYAVPGYFQVRLIATDSNGCTDTATGHVRVYGSVGVFTTSFIQGCTPLTVNFNATLSNVTSIVWDFADGVTSTPSLATSITHVYTFPGAFLPKLILTDSAGCQTASPGTDTIKVDMINIGFIMIPGHLCLDSFFTCTDTSSSYWSAITGRNWTFDGDTSTLISPSFVADTAGSYPVTLQLTDGWGCTATETKTITVYPFPNGGIITGPSVLCQGGSVILTDTTGGGAWRSSSGTIATISSYRTGDITLNGLLAGIDSIQYIIGNGFCADTVTKTITIIDTPAAISGASSVCTTTTISLSDAVGGGAWSSNNSAVATVNAAGVVTGGIAGFATISYTTGCGASAIKLITVVADPTAISGMSSVCSGVSIALSDTIGGGTWSSDNSTVATVVVTGVVTTGIAGIATITYSTGCGTNAIKTITVIGTPTAILGPSSVCVTSSITLSNAAGGGTWSTSNSTVASVSATGLVTGGIPGIATITYSTGCGANATKVIMVIADPSVISGASSVCSGASIALSDTVGGGTWGTNNANVATVSGRGIATAGTAGSAMITYTTGCGTGAVKIITVIAIPVAISGDSVVCPAASITLSDSVGGGIWSCINTSLASIDTTGIVTGLSAGIAVITYSAYCGYAFTTVTVTPSPNAGAITGRSGTCVEYTITLSDGIAGGTWNSSNTTATVSLSGVITGMIAGIDTISYTAINSCGTAIAATVITIDTIPSAGRITGMASVCVGAITILSDSVSGGVWVATNNAIAAISGNIINGVSPGSDTIRYIVSNGFCTDTVTQKIVVYKLPGIDSIIGQPIACKGVRFSLSDSVTGGHWSSSNTPVATIDSITGVVNSIAAGFTIINYMVGPDSNGCYNSAVFTTTVIAKAIFIVDSSVSEVTCYGNNDGKISITLSDAMPPFRYLWSNGSTDSSISGLDTGLYTLNVIEIPTQCNETNSFYISEPDSLVLTPSVTNDLCYKNAGSIHIDVSGGTQPYSYLWSNNTTGAEAVGLGAGTYSVTVTDTNNCIKELSAIVGNDSCFSIIIHDVLTPNGDGYNDTWIIEGLDYYPDNIVQVFDKWGDLVYEKTDYKNDWGGRGKNGLLPDGTYYYLVKLNAKRLKGGENTWTGSVLIKR